MVQPMYYSPVSVYYYSHPQVDQYKAGKTKVINSMMGALQKKTQGRVEPATSMKMLKDKLMNR